MAGFGVAVVSERAAPSQRSGYGLFVPVPARWNDLDIFGHLNNAVFYELFDTAILRVLASTGTISRDAPLAALVVDSGATFHREVLFELAISVGLRVAHLGRTSVRYQLGVFVEDAQSSAVDGHVTHVFVDRVSRRPVEIPKIARDGFQAMVVT